MARPEIDWDDEYSAPKRRFLPGRGVARIGGYSLIVLVVLVLLYYVVGAFIMHSIDDDPNFQAINEPEGGSHAVAATAALIDREIDTHFWTANDPFFYPSALLDNTPNYQQGIIYALSRFTIEMADQIGRTRGSSEVDADLDKAAGLLKYPGNVWIFDLSTSFLPTPASETQYRAASRALKAYNDRLAAGQAIFERRSDNLIATLDRIASDLGSASATLDQHLAKPRPLLVDTKVDDIFYGVKGRLYGYSILLRELGRDFDGVIKDRQLGPAWEQMMQSLNQAAILDPVVVMNGAPDGAYFPSHLAVQGFYLLRARTQLREITNILLK
ncbi:DUF2333 family protein [Thalassobaculum litoreum]|uniref:DUF2333 family protein n=1 Tax=Thalassobaculum litoreum DSM 18839 TaxID=1123362 RepID=A0A8G2EXE9_9PROT|nr:DUF2333 family protein [Thalassobaculum litoreum]SDF38130.1 hypothetical protein SAMN05660686_01092 [Thalassobaculum litoreum DSM 18839]